MVTRNNPSPTFFSTAENEFEETSSANFASRRRRTDRTRTSDVLAERVFFPQLNGETVLRCDRLGFYSFQKDNLERTYVSTKDLQWRMAMRFVVALLQIAWKRAKVVRAASRHSLSVLVKLH